MSAAVIDFETRSRLSVRDVGSVKYATDPTTSVICLAYAIDDGPVGLWTPGEPPPENLVEHIVRGRRVEAHNAGFERAIWENILVPLGFPEVPFDSWNCTSARASAVGLPPKLEKVADVLGLSTRKDMDGHKKMQTAARPKFPKKNDPRYLDYYPDQYAFPDDPDLLARVGEYFRTDVGVERELGAVVPDLSPLESRIWLIDQFANDRGIYVDRESVDIILDRIDELERENLPRFAEITSGKVTAPGQVGKMVEWIRTRGVNLPNLQSETVERALAGKLPDDVREVLNLRNQFAGSAVKKYRKLRDSLGDDNRVRDTLVYCGASRTGRWSGRRVQPQNLFRPLTSNVDITDASFEALRRRDWPFLSLVYGDEMTAFASMTRSVFTSTPGFELFVADFSSIEARFLFWIADDFEALDDIRNGRDVYITMAAAVYGKRYSDVSDDERQFGKKLILGLGYGMGPDKFLDQCRNDGLDLPAEFIRNAVRLYRELHSPVVRLWRTVDRAARRVIETGSSVSLAGGRLLLEPSDLPLGGFTLRLPSGRKLYYHGARIRPVKKRWKPDDEEQIVDVIKILGIDKTGGFSWSETYGSKLVENLVQGGSRDLMARSMVRIDRAGYSILWSAHDEIIAEKRDGNLDEFLRLMGTAPKWSGDLPLGVSGWKGTRYRK